MPPPLIAALFDFDGVLLDSEPLHERALLGLYDARGWVAEDPTFRAFKGRTETVNFAHIAATFGGEADAHRADYRARYHALLDADPPLVPGAHAFVEACRARGLRCAVVTSAPRSTVDLVFAHHGLAGLFETVVAADDVARAKPHPDPYLDGAARLGVDPAACLVVEDSLHGVAAGVAAGAFVAGRVASFDADDLADAGAATTFADYADLARTLWGEEAFGENSGGSAGETR